MALLRNWRIFGYLISAYKNTTSTLYPSLAGHPSPSFVPVFTVLCGQETHGLVWEGKSWLLLTNYDNSISVIKEIWGNTRKRFSPLITHSWKETWTSGAVAATVWQWGDSPYDQANVIRLLDQKDGRSVYPQWPQWPGPVPRLPVMQV